MLGLAPDRACLLPKIGTVGSYPTLSPLAPRQKNGLGEERSSLCGAFRTLTGPALPRYPALRRPDFPLRDTTISYSGCPILRPYIK